MLLRRATMNDAEVVLEWRNDEDTRAMSRDGAPIARAQHLRWFEAAVADSNRRLLIAEIAGRKVGMVRFDRDGEAWEVSINVAPTERSRGLGRAMLAAGVACLLKEVGPTAILADILESNARSVRVFEAVGFRRLNPQGAAILRYERPAAAGP